MCASTALRRCESSGWQRTWARCDPTPMLFSTKTSVTHKCDASFTHRQRSGQGSFCQLDRVVGESVKGGGGPGQPAGGRGVRMQLQHLPWQLHILHAVKESSTLAGGKAGEPGNWGGGGGGGLCIMVQT